MQNQFKETYIVFAPYDRIVKLFLFLFPKWLLPNHLTLIRLFGTLVLIYLLLVGNYVPGLILFICLALTDIFDGSLARLRKQITAWGELWDPIADKFLIGATAIILLIKTDLFLTILLVAFELILLGGGLYIKKKRKDVELKANMWGKIKMNFHGFGVGFLILGFLIDADWSLIVARVILYASLLFAFMSMYRREI